MRRIGIVSDSAKLEEACRLFTRYDIRCTIDCQQDTSWESESYGQNIFSIFVEDEDDADRATALLNEAMISAPLPILTTAHLTPLCEHAAQNYLQQRFSMPFETKRRLTQSSGLLTFLLVALCIGLFIFDMYSKPSMPHQAFTPIQKVLSFDYPRGLAIQDSVLEAGLQRPPQVLLKTTSMWGGLYPYILEKAHHTDTLPKRTLDTTLLLEKVRDGEAWRLVSPCVLHCDIFHLLFNMLWLIALGVQVEKRLPFLRFAILLFAIAIISNAAQYCMSGPFFFGFSGVIFGLLGFIATRNDLFPWEGYSLQPSAYTCVLFFMWALVFLSLCSFLADWYLNAAFPIGFANTAHVAGLFAGIQLGKASFFCAKKNRCVV